MAGTRFLDPTSIPLKRQRGGNIWATLVPVIQGAIAIGVLTILGLFFVPVLNTQSDYKTKLAELGRKTAAADETQHQLMLETQRMKDDPVYVEHIARDTLNMGKPGEVIIRFDRYQNVPGAKPVRALDDTSTN